MHEIVSVIDILQLLGYQFFQHALLGGIIAAVACTGIGLFLILRKEAMIADGISHTAFGGIALGLLLGVYPVITALIVSIFAVLGISYLKRKGYAQSDSAIAVMLALGFSTGLIILSLVKGFNVELFSYLFGSILTINQLDLLTVLLLGFSTILFLGLFYKELLAITFDEQSAKLTGIPTGAFTLGFNLLVATTIVLSIKIIGIILVVALIVLPGLSALQLRRSFRQTLFASFGFGGLSVFAGIFLSALFDVAASGVIVVLAVIFFFIVVLYRRLR
jgi:zinc transport system permease protein